MKTLTPIPSAVIGMIRQGARERDLPSEALPAALERMSRDIFPEADWFAACFSGAAFSEETAGQKAAVAATDWRGIGDAFRRTSPATREQRKQDGSFYTPDAVIDQILQLVWKSIHGADGSPRGTVCDPAVGCGYFLLRLLDRMKKRHGSAAARRWAASSLFGVDKDPAAVLMTRILVWLSLSDKRTEFIPDPEHIRQGDSLLDAPFPVREKITEEGFDCVIGNPPYEVLTNFARRPDSRALAESLRESGRYHDSLSGQINLYRCFIERSLDLLRPGGMLSFVVPLSLARDSAALPLRKRLLEQERAAEWRLFGERDAALDGMGVTQAACIFSATRGAGAAKKIAVSAMGERSVVTLSELRRNGGGSHAVPMLDKAGLALWRWLWKHVPGRLDAVAEMRVGEVDQTVFRDCMRDERDEMSGRGEGAGHAVLARGAHLSPFMLDVSPSPGKERFLDLDLFFKKKGSSAAVCRERASVPRVAQMGIRNMDTRPRLVAALLPPGVHAGNSLNVYTPLSGVPAEFLAGMLNSRLLDWLFRVGSGNNNINLTEMRALPFPVPADETRMAAVAAAYRGCAAIAEAHAAQQQNSGSDAKCIEAALRTSRARLDAAVESCYGAPSELIPSALESECG